MKFLSSPRSEDQDQGPYDPKDALMTGAMIKRVAISMMVAALGILTASSAVAVDPTDGSNETTPGTTGTLSAQVANTSVTGRTISSVTDATAEVIDSNSGSTLVAGIPSTIIVDEVLATGSDTWHVQMQVDDAGLCDSGGTNCIAEEAITIVGDVPTDLTGLIDPGTGSTLGLSGNNPSTSLALGTDGLATSSPTMTAGASENATTDPLIFSVDQEPGGTYTGTYVGTASFTVDLWDSANSQSRWTGSPDNLTADFTVTLWE